MSCTRGCPFLLTSSWHVCSVKSEMLAASEEPEAQQCSYVSAGALADGHVLFVRSPPGSQG